MSAQLQKMLLLSGSNEVGPSGLTAFSSSVVTTSCSQNQMALKGLENTHVSVIEKSKILNVLGLYLQQYFMHTV